MLKYFFNVGRLTKGLSIYLSIDRSIYARLFDRSLMATNDQSLNFVAGKDILRFFHLFGAWQDTTGRVLPELLSVTTAFWVDYTWQSCQEYGRRRRRWNKIHLESRTLVIASAIQAHVFVDLLFLTAIDGLFWPCLADKTSCSYRVYQILFFSLEKGSLGIYLVHPGAQAGF